MSVYGSVGGRWSWEPRVLRHLAPNGGRRGRGIVAAVVVVDASVELVSGSLCLRDTTEIVLSLGAVPSDVADLLALVTFSFTMQGTRSPNDDETVGCEALGMA